MNIDTFHTIESHEKYLIDIPLFWKKEDLLDLKDFLEKSTV